MLLHILQDMFRQESIYQKARLQQRGDQVDDDDWILQVELGDFESRAREQRVFDVTEFSRSDAFAEAGYAMDDNRRVIIRSAFA